MKSSPRRWSRRQWLVGTAVAGLGTVVVRRARADETRGQRILIVGDSMIAGGLGLFLERSLHEEYGYVTSRRGKVSSGLARPDFFNWIKEVRRLVGDNPPDASVVMFGGNDVQGLYMGKDTWIRWQDDGWAEEYARRVNAFCDIIAPDRQQIFWVGMPVMRPPKFHARVQRVNTIYRAEMAIRPRALFVDIWRLLADENGAYAHRIVLDPTKQGGKRVKKVRVRAGDGIHLSPAGARYVADHIKPIVHERLSQASP